MRNIIQLLSVISFLFLFGCNSHKNNGNSDSKAFMLTDTMFRTTTFAKVIEEPLKNELEFFGKITADNNKLIEIYPVVGGSVTKVYVELGDYVKKGQLLATIRSTEVAGFEKELNDAKSDVVVSRNNLKVAQEMYEGKLSTEREIGRAHV